MYTYARQHCVSSCNPRGLTISLLYYSVYINWLGALSGKYIRHTSSIDCVFNFIRKYKLCLNKYIEVIVYNCVYIYSISLKQHMSKHDSGFEWTLDTFKYLQINISYTFLDWMKGPHQNNNNSNNIYIYMIILIII